MRKMRIHLRPEKGKQQGIELLLIDDRPSFFREQTRRLTDASQLVWSESERDGEFINLGS